MRKFLPESLLSATGWHNVHRDSVIVSFCESCRCQQCHVCSGEKSDGNGVRVFRFECVVCLDRLNGRNRHSRGFYGKGC